MKYYFDRLVDIIRIILLYGLLVIVIIWSIYDDAKNAINRRIVKVLARFYRE